MVCVYLCGSLRAQSPAFHGVIQGVLIECDASGAAGQFALRAHGTDQVYRFTFDARTYVEREQRRITPAGLRMGDTIEVVSDRDENVAVHYARTVHVIEAKPVAPPLAESGRYRMRRVNPAMSPIDLIAPRGNLTFAGVIARLGAGRLVLHTRREGDMSILLRLDTRYLDSGSLVDAADLKPNTRVFIRAGKNLDDQVEAYQVVWGEILEPAHGR